MSTATDYIYQALRKIGHMRSGYTVQPELMNDALFEWGSMFDSWNAERTLNYSIPDVTYVVNGLGSQTGGNGYLIGPTATTAPATPTTLPGGPNDFLGPRPTSIARANLVMTNLSTQPVRIALRSVTMEEWASLSVLQINPINVTSIFYYDPQWPNGVFNVFPPLNGNSIELFTWGVLAPPATLGATYSAPPGYQDAIIWTLAERLFDLATKDIGIHPANQMRLAGKAYESQMKLRAINRSLNTLATDFPSGNKPDGYYDSFTYQTGIPY